MLTRKTIRQSNDEVNICVRILLSKPINTGRVEVESSSCSRKRADKLAADRLLKERLALMQWFVASFSTLSSAWEN